MTDPLSRRFKKPEMNVKNSMLECQTCREEVHEGSYDFGKQTLKYWCSRGHESVVEDLVL